MRGEVHILVNCPIDTFLKEKQHSAMDQKLLCCQQCQWIYQLGDWRCLDIVNGVIEASRKFERKIDFGINVLGGEMVFSERP